MGMKPHELVSMLVAAHGGSLPVAKAMGKPSFQGTLYKIADGKVTSPQRSSAERIAKFFGIPVDALYDEAVATRVAQELGQAAVEAMGSIAANESFSAGRNPQLFRDEEFALVERADVAVSAGHGHVVFHEGRKSGLSFRRDFLRAQGVNEANAVVVDVKGRSMEPSIPDGAVLLVNRAAKEIVNGRIYAFRSDGELLVKRLHVRGGQVIAVSDNPDRDEYPDRVIDPARDFEIIGRALWMGSRL